MKIQVDLVKRMVITAPLDQTLHSLAYIALRNVDYNFEYGDIVSISIDIERADPVKEPVA